MKKLLLLLVLIGSVVFGQLSGTYYIGAVADSRPGGGNPEYASLSAAFTDLNTNGVSGPVIMYFLDEDYTEAANIALACTGTSATNTITFKPYTGVTPNIHFTQLADNAGPSGRIVLGSNTIASYTLVTMDYVTFDGSNTVSGTTRDLSITEVNNTPAFQYGVRFVGDVNNITFKNVKITISETGGTSSYAILVTPRNQSATDFIPDNIIVDNCEVIITGGGACQGMAVAASGTLLGPNYPTGIVFRNNKITARTRGVFLSTGSGNTDIYGNEIYINQTNATTLSQGVYAFSVANATRTINIYNNRFMQLQTANAGAGDFGILGIYLGTQGIYNVYNNMIAGITMSTVAADPSCVVEGIRVSAATVNGITTNIYHNSILIPDFSQTPGAGTIIPKGIFINMSGASGTRVADVKNNLFVSQEDDFLTYSIHWSSTANGSSLTSNYNNLSFTTNGKAGLYSATVCDAIADWRTASSQDLNSNSAIVALTSATDLHLDIAGLPNYSLVGTTLSSPFDVDIDGETRHATYPYIGADENLANVMPVELTTFTAVARGKNVELKWATATETNNLGFDVEKSVNGVWSKIGFVNGAGNSNSPKEYGYVDAVSENATYSYRLKQIDRDGKFTYNAAIEVHVNASVNSYQLAQNFPNPFNPTTTIRFSVPQIENASVKVYDVTGREVATLFNGVATPGQVYNVQFNGAGLASGIYFYVLQTQSYRDVKKMSLLK